MTNLADLKRTEQSAVTAECDRADAQTLYAGSLIAVISASVKAQVDAQMALNIHMYAHPLTYIPDDDCYLTVRRALDDCANAHGLRRVAVFHEQLHLTQYRDRADRLIATLHNPTPEL